MKQHTETPSPVVVGFELLQQTGLDLVDLFPYGLHLWTGSLGLAHPLKQQQNRNTNVSQPSKQQRTSLPANFSFIQRICVERKKTKTNTCDIFGLVKKRK
jgi:hypothetical protein